MQSRCYKIENLNGLHARPAAELLQTARTHGCSLLVKIDAGWQEAGLMKLLTLGMGEGTLLEIGVEGGAEELCLVKLGKIFERGNNKFDS